MYALLFHMWNCKFYFWHFNKLWFENWGSWENKDIVKTYLRTQIESIWSFEIADNSETAASLGMYNEGCSQ